MRLIKRGCEREAIYPPLLEIPEFEKLMCKIPRVWRGIALCKLDRKKHSAQPNQKNHKGRKPIVSVMQRYVLQSGIVIKSKNSFT